MMNKLLSAIVLSSVIGFSGCRKDDTDPNRFPREKILTISAKEYCESLGKNLSDYELVGVIGLGSRYISYDDIPKETEIIVGYIGVGRTFREAGTALIPKKK